MKLLTHFTSLLYSINGSTIYKNRKFIASINTNKEKIWKTNIHVHQWFDTRLKITHKTYKKKNVIDKENVINHDFFKTEHMRGLSSYSFQVSH